MRLILHALARANLRWAAADLARAERLGRDIDAAQDSADVHLKQSRRLFERACILRA